MTCQIVNPTDGKVLRSFEHLDKAQLEQSLAAAQTCFQAWRHTSFAERAAIVHKAAKLLHAHVDDFARLATLEMGKRINEARGEVTFSADIVAYCARHAERFLAPTKLDPKVGQAHMSHDQSEKVIDDPRIKGAALTGSVAAGRSIAARTGRNLKKSSMELGGSDAFIVLDSIADEFLAKFHAALERVKIGDPLDETTTHGPLSSEAALVQLIAQVDSAVQLGARLLKGGKRVARPGSFMETTILTDIQPGNPAFRDEFFGPVVSVYQVTDEAAAIALANDSDFGLGGSVWTKDVAPGKRIASAVDTGMMFINNIDWSDAELPFGGIKDSGYGRELGDMGIQEFVNKKLVRTAHLDAPAWA